MSLDFPWEMFARAQQQRNQNQQDMYQNINGIGQGLGQMGEVIGQAVKAQKQKALMGQLVAAMNGQGQPQQGPRQAVPAGPPIQGPAGYSPPNQQPNSSAIPAGQMPMKMGEAPVGPPQDNEKLIQSLIMQMDPKKGVEMMTESPWAVVANMLTPEGNPIQQNKMSGAVRPVNLKATPTGRGNAGFGTGSVNWETATNEDRDIAKSLYEGRVRPMDLGYRDRSIGVKLANEYALRNGLPPYKAYAGEVAGSTAKAFASGKFGANSLSLNTALGHVNTVYDAFQGISNTDQKWLNQPMNKLKLATGDPNVAKLGTALNALRGELATVFKGSAGTDQEIAGWMNYLNDSLTPVQVSAVIPQIDELLRSRLSALEYQRESGMGGRGEAPLLSPHAAEISKKVKGTNESVVENGWIYTPGLGGKANQANWKKQ